MDGADFTQLDAAELHRGPHRQAAHALGEAQQIVLDHRVRLLEGQLPGLEKGEDLVLRRRLGIAGLGRQEGQAAGDDGGEGFRIDLHPVGPELDVHTAGVPEAGVGGDEAVVGRLDEDAQIHMLARIVEAETGDLADRDAAVIHRRAHVEGTQGGRLQGEIAAGHIEVDHRRLVEPLEITPRFVGLAHVHAHVGARQQGVQPGHGTARHPRTDHPEARVIHQQASGLAGQPGGGDNMAAVLGQGHGTQLADVHILVLDAGLAGLEAHPGTKGDGDGGPLLIVGARRKKEADQGGHQRDDPYQRDAEAPWTIHHSDGKGRRFGVSHGRAGEDRYR